VSRGKKLALLAIVVVIWAIGVMAYGGFYPFNMIGMAPTQVVVTIVPGSAVNPRLGFSPVVIRLVIGVNNTVVWKNEDTTWHTAHSNIPEFDSRMIQPGSSFMHTFNTPGSYPYHCDPHPWMTGLIIVKAPSASGITQSDNPLRILAQLLVKSCDRT
jgi:plastocyanin